MIFNEAIVKKCCIGAKKMRIDAINTAYGVGNIGTHFGGTLSMIEIMAVLYLAVMKYDINNPRWEGRDRFILSKGHGVLAQYTALKQIGLIDDNELATFKKNETDLYAHPSRNLDKGIEFSSGSLGQGVSLGVGVALSLRKKDIDSKVYVLVGDGECDEGSVWEALLTASHYNLKNLTVIVDKNKLQYDGPTDDVLSLDNLGNKFREFGFDVIDVDGHNIKQLLEAFYLDTEKPKAIIANTIKGKGVSFMENNALWHNGRLSEKQYLEAIKEQEM